MGPRLRGDDSGESLLRTTENAANQRYADKTFTPSCQHHVMALKTSAWRAERNRKALARLTKALPAIFPAPVLTYALKRAFIPPMPRLAIDGYWRAHPLRADRLARALAAKSGAPAGWT